MDIDVDFASHHLRQLHHRVIANESPLSTLGRLAVLTQIGQAEVLIDSRMYVFCFDPGNHPRQLAANVFLYDLCVGQSVELVQKLRGFPSAEQHVLFPGGGVS